MRDTPRAKSAGGVPGPVFRRIEGNENIRKEGFYARFAGFTHNGVRQFISRGHDAFAKTAQLRAAIADRELRPCALGNSGMGNDPRQRRRRRSLKMREHFARSRIDRRKRVDGNGRGSHKRDSNRFWGWGVDVELPAAEPLPARKAQATQPSLDAPFDEIFFGHWREGTGSVRDLSLQATWDALLSQGGHRHKLGDRCPPTSNYDSSPRTAFRRSIEKFFCA